MSYKLSSLEGLIFLSYFTSYRIGVIYIMHELYGELTIEDFYKEFTMRAEMFKKYDNEQMSPKHFNEAYRNTYICMQQLEYYGVEAIPYFHEKFPSSLKQLADCPPVIYLKGTLRNEIPMAAVVGTRKMSDLGARKTSFVVDMMNQSKFGIVSGLAEGIDTIAHFQTLQNKSYTIAVLAQPLNKIFPPENYKLANDIVSTGGALISELPFGISRGKADFVMRNRLQVALSRIVVPIELEPKSGTMWTVDYAKKFETPLFLIVPNEQEENLTQYSGIIHLINLQKNKPQSSVYVIQNSEQFKRKLGQLWADDFFNPQQKLFE